MGHVAKSQQQARAKARQRRIALDHDRTVRDEHVEEAAGEVFLALAERADALGQVQAAEIRGGDALQRILAEGIKADGVAQLCDLPVGEVHRLRRAAQTAPAATELMAFASAIVYGRPPYGRRSLPNEWMLSYLTYAPVWGASIIVSLPM
jgi:hypothetical protein